MKASILRLFSLLALAYTVSAVKLCRKAGYKCVSSCIGVEAGHYHSCETCMAYVSCNGGIMYAPRPCPGEQAWDDSLKRCVPNSKTCGPCGDQVRVKAPTVPPQIIVTEPAVPTEPRPAPRPRPSRPRPHWRRQDRVCKQRGGFCVDVCRNKKACTNGALYASMCGGPHTRRCCIRGDQDWVVDNGDLYGHAPGLTSNCLCCIGMASGGVANVGRCGSTCGPYGLTHAYYNDCCNFETYETCATQMSCSRRCVRAYLAKYSNGLHHDCEYYARLHRGGPNGWKSVATKAFWHKVLRCCRDKGGC